MLDFSAGVGSEPFDWLLVLADLDVRVPHLLAQDLFDTCRDYVLADRGQEFAVIA